VRNSLYERRCIMSIHLNDLTPMTPPWSSASPPRRQSRRATLKPVRHTASKPSEVGTGWHRSRYGFDALMTDKSALWRHMKQCRQVVDHTDRTGPRSRLLTDTAYERDLRGPSAWRLPRSASSAPPLYLLSRCFHYRCPDKTSPTEASERTSSLRERSPTSLTSQSDIQFQRNLQCSRPHAVVAYMYIHTLETDTMLIWPIAPSANCTSLFY